MAYQYKPFDYAPPPGLSAAEPRHDVVIVGAGPVGLAAALELANFGVRVVLVDDNNVVSVGSRAICWSKRSLEILDRLGIGDACVEKGVIWKVGRTYNGAEEVFHFDLQPDAGYKMPAFVNLQQYYIEEMLAERCLASPLIDVRFKNRVTQIQQDDEHVSLTIETPDGPYQLEASYVLACDGARSPIRAMMGLQFDGELFEERFLIADIEMTADFPSERRFWFQPVFHTGQSALLHKQPDHIYRIDLQLGWDADPDIEIEPERVRQRIEKVVGHSDFKLDWTSIYTFQCRRLANFVHQRVIFAGDSAHVVSPFGARGGNSGLQDVDALGWRLATVVKGEASAKVLNDYDRERTYGADENILNSSRSTRFMSPDKGAETLFRDAVLALSRFADFARPMVNSGRLSVPCCYPLAAPDDASMPAASRPGMVAPDAPLGDGWLLEKLAGHFTVLAINCDTARIEGAETISITPDPIIQSRYLGDVQKAAYLIRPDQVVAARFENFDAPALEAMMTSYREGLSWD